MAIVHDDVSVVMHRRATSLNNLKNFANARGIGLMPSDEGCPSTNMNASNRKENKQQLVDVWKFIDRIETLTWRDSETKDDSLIWHGRSLIDAGVLRFLAKQDSKNISIEKKEIISTVGFHYYDSPVRR